MYHELENLLFKESNEKIAYYLGIQNFKKSIASYGKILYNHSSLVYDNESIYFIDKLHLTYCLTQMIDIKITNSYHQKEIIRIDNYLELKPNYSNGNNYHLSFSIKYDGVHFGFLHLKNTKTINLCKIEIDNRILYEESIIYILARLYHVVISMNLTFKNINIIEIARDSAKETYKDLSKIYYQSTKCNNIVNELSGKLPIYKPVTKVQIHDYPDNIGKRGTFKIGGKKSHTNIKIYDKTNEIVCNDSKKNYIKEIHDKHFGINKIVTRVEVAINSTALRKNSTLSMYDSDLIQILNPKNYPNIFYGAIGDKLTFNIISTKIWNNSNNDKYEKIRLLPQLELSLLNQKRLVLPYKNNGFIHANNLNKSKNKIYEYLDDDIPYNEIKRYFKSKKDKGELNTDELLKSFNTVKHNYKNSQSNERYIKVNNLIQQTCHEKPIFTKTSKNITKQNCIKLLHCYFLRILLLLNKNQLIMH
ncbi:MAG: hypothetical protein ACOYMA_17650 [Bacteroidia bacterium]